MIPAYFWTSLWVSLDCHYGGKLAFSMHTKAITVNLYSFHRNMSPIWGPFQETDKTGSTYTKHLKSGQAVCPSVPLPWSLFLSATDDDSSTQLLLILGANFTLNNGMVVKHKHDCDSLISVQKQLSSHTGQKPLSSTSEVNWRFVTSVFIIVTTKIWRVIMWIVKFDIP